MSKRIYVDNVFAKKLKVLAASNDKTVIDLTKNLDVQLCKGKKFGKKVLKNGWVTL